MTPTDFIGTDRVDIDFTTEADIAGLNPTTSSQRFSQSIEWGFGDDNLEVNEVYPAVRTLLAGATETLDLIGVLVGLFGQTINFTTIKGIYVKVVSGDSITLGEAASDPWTGPLDGTDPTNTVTRGNSWHQTKADDVGWPVTPMSAENLMVTNNDMVNPATYLIVLKGCTT